MHVSHHLLAARQSFRTFFLVLESEFRTKTFDQNFFKFKLIAPDLRSSSSGQDAFAALSILASTIFETIYMEIGKTPELLETV